MTEIAFTIKQRPDGKWMVESGLSSYGPFDSHALALDGMQRLIAPPTFTYDRNGDPT